MGSVTVEKHSVTIPSDISQEVRNRVGSRGFSAYVSAATERQLRRDALDELIAAMEPEFGQDAQVIYDQLKAKYE